MMERRRILLRLSLVLNAVLLALSLYVAQGGDPPAFMKKFGNARRAEEVDTLAAQRRLGHKIETNGAGNVVHYFNDDVKPDYDDKEEKCAPAAAQACSICTAGPVGKKLCAEWGSDVIEGIVTFAGTNHRLRRALAKMRRGEPFKMASIGGSVSSGHGLYYYGPGRSTYAPTNMHHVLFEYLNSTFPAAEGSVLAWEDHYDPKSTSPVNTFVNSAQPARGSDYFAKCSHLDVPLDVDLIVVELGINDTPDLHSVYNFELLIRSLLEYKNNPGVLVFNVFALMFDTITMGGELSQGIGHMYDVPTLSTLYSILPLAYQNKTKLFDWFTHNDGADPETLNGVDLRHFGPYMHVQSGEMMKAYIELQLCEMDRLEAKAGRLWKIDDLYPLDPLPPTLLTSRYNPDKPVGKLSPFCMATNSETFPLTSKDMAGWRPWAWKDKKYLVADKPGAHISFEFTTTLGEVILYFLRSREFGLGNLACEIEGMPDQRKILRGYWNEKWNIGRTESWMGLDPGTYKLNCELLTETDDPNGGTEFRLIALMGL